MARPAAIIPVANDRAHINIMLYGDPGCGKTVLAGTSPKCLILDADDGTESAAAQSSRADKWRINDYHDLADAYEYLRHEGIPNDVYSWVWLDSGTIFQDLGMDQILADLKARKPDRSDIIPDQAQYLENQNRFGRWVREMKSLPINFGIICHAMRQEDEDGKVLYLPSLQGGQGALSKKVCGYMGVVGYYYVVNKKEGTQRILVTEKRSKYMAKDRFAAFGGRLVDPTIPKMEALVAAKLAASKSRTTATKKTTTRRTAARK